MTGYGIGYGTGLQNDFDYTNIELRMLSFLKEEERNKMPCRIKKHMTVETVKGIRTLVFNYSCLPHEVIRKSFRTAEGRELSIDGHLAKKVTKSSDMP